MKQAESIIIKTTQWHAFKEEIIVLRNLSNKDMFKSHQSSRERNENIKKISSLCKLDPFLNQDGLVRKVQLKQANSGELLGRPIHKLILVLPHQRERKLGQYIFPNEEPVRD